MGPAWSIRSQLLAQGIAGIQALLGRSEDRHLDFKLKTDPTMPGLSEQDKKNLSKCISGFANSYGGLVVWGVKSERQAGVQDAAEVATALLPIDRPEEFKQMLEQAAPQAVTPAVPDISNDVILELSGKGYVLTHVPVSYRGPHAANWPAPSSPHARYFRRMGDGNHPCDAYALVEILNRRFSPTVRLTWRVLYLTDKRDGNLTFQLGALLTNEGPGRVREYSLRLTIDKSVIASPDSPGFLYLGVRYVTEPTLLRERACLTVNSNERSRTIFPEDSFDLLQDRGFHIGLHFPSLYGVVPDDRTTATLVWRLYVEDNPVQYGELLLSTLLDSEWAASK